MEIHLEQRMIDWYYLVLNYYNKYLFNITIIFIFGGEGEYRKVLASCTPSHYRGLRGTGKNKIKEAEEISNFSQDILKLKQEVHQKNEELKKDNYWEIYMIKDW